jgi:ABC-type transport system involved in multi-copper enzyme maturation permease subunit
MSSPVTFLTDFSDRISPMLVKELRQGMRAKTFIGVFLALQIFLGVMLFSAGASSTSDQVGSVISGIIFMFFAVAVLVVQPLRGTGALSSEVKGNTIDMMVLTRLSAWRIVFGKWVAIVGQSALLLSTIVPYLILRYFFGGMNLFAEIVLLTLMFLTSMALTAFTVGLSGCSSVIVRALLPVLGLPIMLWSIAVMFLFRGFGGSSDIMDLFSLDNSEARIGVVVYVAALIYIGWSMLSLGASLIAPAAENHSLWRRVVAMGFMVILIPIAAFANLDEEWVMTLIFVLAVPAIVIALTDSSHLVSTVCEPFLKFGAAGKTLGWLFYPTWHSGILFAILLGMVSMVAVFAQSIGEGSGFLNDADDAVVFLSLFGGLYFPAVWQLFLFRGEGQRIAHYLLLLVGSFVMLGILMLLAESMNSGGFLWAFAWNPLAFIAMLEESKLDDSTLLLGVLIVDIVLLGILACAAIAGLGKSSSILRESEITDESHR